MTSITWSTPLALLFHYIILRFTVLSALFHRSHVTSSNSNRLSHLSHRDACSSLCAWVVCHSIADSLLDLYSSFLLFTARHRALQNRRQCEVSETYLSILANLTSSLNTSWYSVSFPLNVVLYPWRVNVYQERANSHLILGGSHQPLHQHNSSAHVNPFQCAIAKPCSVGVHSSRPRYVHLPCAES